jgi:hypothetical protein
MHKTPKNNEKIKQNHTKLDFIALGFHRVTLKKNETFVNIYNKVTLEKNHLKIKTI